LNEIDEKTRVQIQERYFQRSFEEIYKDIRAYYSPQEVAAAERNPRQMMGYVFRWYFGYTNQLALRGDEKNKVDFQIHCGPAMGAFNQWVKNTRLEDWSNRHVDEIALKIMHEAADVLNLRMKKFYRYV
jgi:trans-AT polyketide synthase/acyltransferase/oxidoreductase domain-containing protein